MRERAGQRVGERRGVNRSEIKKKGGGNRRLFFPLCSRHNTCALLLILSPGRAISPIFCNVTPRGSEPLLYLKLASSCSKVGGAGSASAACQPSEWTSPHAGSRPSPSGRCCV